MKNKTTARRNFLGSAAGLALASSLLNSKSANAHVVEINAIGPTQQQVQEFLALPEEPIVMVNLLKFKADGGAEQYARYIEGVRPLLEGVGARVLFSSTAAMCLIGKGDWDSIVLVEYPRPAALLQMSASAEYQAIAGYREAGLQGQINYAVWQN